jgi:type IV pilus assembly protein PilM
MDDGSAGALPPIAASAQIFRPEPALPGEPPVTLADRGPEPPATNGDDAPDREQNPITLVIRDVRPNRLETPVSSDASPSPAERVPDPLEAVPVPNETFTVPAETIQPPVITDVPDDRNGRAVADEGGPDLSPPPGDAGLPLPEAAEPLFAAGDRGMTEPAAVTLPDPVLLAGEGEFDTGPQEDQTTAAALPPKTERFKRALSGLALFKRGRPAETGSGPDVHPDEAATGTAEATPPKAARFRVVLPGLGSLQKTATVGIDIGHDYLRLVRTVKTSGGKWDVRDRRRFALPPKASRETSEFSSLLKSALASVCGSAKRTDLWVCMSAANVDVRHIRIPKVSKKQIANAVYWTVKKETPFDEKELILDFETQGEVIEQGIAKLSVMVYTAPRREVEDLKELFVRIGRPLTGISIVPFSVQNLFRTGWITTQGGNIASLFIGNDFSRIDIYAEDNLVMTRGIKAGLSSMVEALVDRFNEHRGGRAPALTIEQGRKIIRSLSPDSPPLKADEAGAELGKGEIFEMILPALERLTRQAERTFEHYATTVPGERIVQIYVSGAMNVYQPIVDYVGTHLGIASALLDPLSEQETAACPDVEDAHCISERIAFGPALGLALSDNQHTPNLMFTYRDRDREASVIRINRAVFAAFIASVLICSAIFSYQNIAVAKKRAALAGIQTQIAQLGPAVDQNQLLQMAAKVAQRQQISRIYAERYLGMVLISELSALTPENIRFTDLKINLGPVRIDDAAKQPPEAAKAQRVEEVTVEGLILGERQLFETTLAAYAMALEASPLFRQVTVQKNAVEPFIKGEALHFILILKVEAQVHG